MLCSISSAVRRLVTSATMRRCPPQLHFHTSQPKGSVKQRRPVDAWARCSALRARGRSAIALDGNRRVEIAYEALQIAQAVDVERIEVDAVPAAGGPARSHSTNRRFL
jgi:hypothetical protein